MLHAQFNIRSGLGWLPEDRRDRWAQLIDEAETKQPRDFDRNGWVVQAMQGAWSASVHTPVPADDSRNGTYEVQHFQHALEAAVRGGRDADTVAAIAGALLGARWGVTAIPVAWQRILHGWPRLRQRNLIKLALAVAGRGAVEKELDYNDLMAHSTWTVHPHDAGVILGPVNAVPTLPSQVDAVVSLCRVNEIHRPAGAVRPEDQIEIWLIDSVGEAKNPHLRIVVDQAAEAVAQLRAEGRTVFLHCAAGQSRTPLVAAIVGSRAKGITPQQALDEVLEALPDANIKPIFAQFVADLSVEQIDPALSDHAEGD